MNDNSSKDTIDMQKISARAAELAAQWQGVANGMLTAKERRVQKRMARLLGNPDDKVLLTKMMDQSFRAKGHKRVADQLAYLIDRFGVPDFLGTFEQFLFRMFRLMGKTFSSIAVPCVVEGIRRDSRRTVVPGESRDFSKHLAKRRREGVRININHLGEAVLGEDESQNRLDGYLRDLADPAIERISIKISTIYSQIQPLAFDHTVEQLVERLGRVYAAARDNRFTRPDGTSVPKFVNLDMEEYRDLDITAAAFMRALGKDEFRELAAGIVLQAYLPDSLRMMQEIATWARKRVEQSGAPISIRIVKGANMEMELVESALKNWPLAPYDNKLEVDANYKRMLLFGLRPENRKAIRLGIASHNLFELAFAHAAAEELGAEDSITYELLEGMGDHIRRTLQAASSDVLLYAPVAEKRHFINAIAYLIRRLDENTADQNFLRYICDLTPGSRDWSFLSEQYMNSVDFIDNASTSSKRTQDRLGEEHGATGPYHTGEFRNEPDTDWSLAQNREWSAAVRDKWMGMPQREGVLEVPAVIGGEDIFADRETREVYDTNRLPEKIHAYSHTMATMDDAKRALDVAVADDDGWRAMGYPERHEVLSRAAVELRKARGDLIGAAALDTGKVFTEADVEVSEAIDFCELYPFTARKFDAMPNVDCGPYGVGLVVSPWNFPIAIPCGGVVALLSAGNSVIFKPASDSVLVAYEICKRFWRAGVPKTALQFLPCSGGTVGSWLTAQPQVRSVILTGSTETGMRMMEKRPALRLAAETGGKNAIIVSSMSDRDQAVADIVHSAFSNCGQKCSASSLVILEKEVYEDELFRTQLVDAARSLHVGEAWDFASKLGPLIKLPQGDLLRGLTELEEGESWALKPEQVGENPYLWSPGIKWGVQRGGYTHMTELFGPVLGVIRAEDLQEAIDIANQTGYGLTSGLESLDEREHEYWKSRIIAGNLYINRGITGAIVLRQPFGGMRKSAIGAGIKAGGPNYVTQFMDFKDIDLPSTGGFQADHRLLKIAQTWQLNAECGIVEDFDEDVLRAARAARSYIYQYEQEFGPEKDYFCLRGQDNIVRYLPVGTVLVRAHAEDSAFEILARCAAVLASGCELILSLPEDLEGRMRKFLCGRDCSELLRGSTVVFEDDEALIRRIDSVDALRYAAPDRVPKIVYEYAAAKGFHIARDPVLMEGRLELIHYFREQAVCFNYHRYGNLGDRAL